MFVLFVVDLFVLILDILCSTVPKIERICSTGLTRRQVD